MRAHARGILFFTTTGLLLAGCDGGDAARRDLSGAATRLSAFASEAQPEAGSYRTIATELADAPERVEPQAVLLEGIAKRHAATPLIPDLRRAVSDAELVLSDIRNAARSVNVHRVEAEALENASTADLTGSLRARITEREGEIARFERESGRRSEEIQELESREAEILGRVARARREADEIRSTLLGRSAVEMAERAPRIQELESDAASFERQAGELRAQISVLLPERESLLAQLRRAEAQVRLLEDGIARAAQLDTDRSAEALDHREAASSGLATVRSRADELSALLQERVVAMAEEILSELGRASSRTGRASREDVTAPFIQLETTFRRADAASVANDALISIAAELRLASERLGPDGSVLSGLADRLDESRSQIDITYRQSYLDATNAASRIRGSDTLRLSVDRLIEISGGNN